jgi:hypothetical protein
MTVSGEKYLGYEVNEQDWKELGMNWWREAIICKVLPIERITTEKIISMVKIIIIIIIIVIAKSYLQI